MPLLQKGLWMSRGLRGSGKGLLCCHPPEWPSTYLLALAPGSPPEEPKRTFLNKEKLLRASAEGLKRGQDPQGHCLPGAMVGPSEVGGWWAHRPASPQAPVYLPPSLGPCCLLSETPKRQVGSLLTSLSLSRRRASESSLSSESSESSDAGEAQGCQGT